MATRLYESIKQKNPAFQRDFIFIISSIFLILNRNIL